MHPVERREEKQKHSSDLDALKLLWCGAKQWKGWRNCRVAYERTIKVCGCFVNVGVAMCPD